MTSRTTTKSVTCFLHYADQYLFIHRTKKGNASDAGLLNGIGGKLEAGEDFLSAAIRETEEETGFSVSHDQVELKAVVNMTGGYPEDWAMCFFRIAVPSMDVPLGMENDEGQLLWLKKDEVLQSEYQLVDDLHYCWKHLSGEDPRVLFAGCQVGPKLTIQHWSSRLL